MAASAHPAATSEAPTHPPKLAPQGSPVPGGQRARGGWPSLASGVTEGLGACAGVLTPWGGLLAKRGWSEARVGGVGWGLSSHHSAGTSPLELEEATTGLNCCRWAEAPQLDRRTTAGSQPHSWGGKGELEECSGTVRVEDHSLARL